AEQASRALGWWRRVRPRTPADRSGSVRRVLTPGSLAIETTAETGSGPAAGRTVCLHGAGALQGPVPGFPCYLWGDREGEGKGTGGPRGGAGGGASPGRVPVPGRGPRLPACPAGGFRTVSPPAPAR